MPGDTPETPIDLSKATKLKEVAFWFKPQPLWIIHTLKTITPEHRALQVISIYVDPYHDTSPDDPIDPKEAIGEENYEQWTDLDGLLVQLWELYAIRTKLIVEAKVGRVYKLVTGLLPHIAERRIVEPVTYADVE